MSSPLGASSAGATLTDWEEHIAVDTTSTLCCGDFLEHTYINVACHNGHTLIDRPQQDWLADVGSHDESDNEDAGAVKTLPGVQTGRETPHRTNIWKDLPSRHYISPNRSSNGGGRSRDRESQPSYSRPNLISRQTTMGSSLLGDSMTEIIAEDLQSENEPTSAILGYCKRKFLRPYVLILSLVGLNPTATETTACCFFSSYVYAFLILLVLIFSYFLQYACAYRGDRGFVNYQQIMPTTSFNGAVHSVGELLFGYIIPRTLHLCGYISAVIVCKICDQEQLQNLVERVFLVSLKPRHLCRTLWAYVAAGLVFLCLLLAYVAPPVFTQTNIIEVHWLAEILTDWTLFIKISFLLITLLQNFIEILVLSSYCIECYLLRVYLKTLSHKLLMHSIETLDWMREMLEFRKLLDHLNHRVATPVCFFIIMNLAYAFAGFVYLFDDFDFHYSALKLVILNIINVLLWLFMGLIPFFLAASVTRTCQAVEANGHQIRVRPFVYHNTSNDDLNSTLLFASSLHMSAKLFRMPIQPNYVCFAILVVSVVVLTLGMCLNLTLLGSF